MIKGFKEFILRGNLIELAVAFVIGAAFANVVSVVVSSIVTPLVSALPGAKVGGFGFSLRGGDLTAPTFINISAVINALIVFVATAAVVYFALVVPMNKINERQAAKIAAGEPDPDPKPDDIVLLEQIRDLLSGNTGPDTNKGTHSAPAPGPGV